MFQKFFFKDRLMFLAWHPFWGGCLDILSFKLLFSGGLGIEICILGFGFALDWWGNSGILFDNEDTY